MLEETKGIRINYGENHNEAEKLAALSLFLCVFEF